MLFRQCNSLQAYDAFVSVVQVLFLSTDLTQSSKSAPASLMVKKWLKADDYHENSK